MVFLSARRLLSCDKAVVHLVDRDTREVFVRPAMLQHPQV
jgi:hypothetical protein